MRRIETKLVAAGLLAAGLVLGTVAVAAASSNAKLNDTLTATGSAPDAAAGKASLKLQKKPGKTTKGNFTVKVKHLDGSSHYDLIVGGAKVGTITTNGGGNGSAAFSTTPGGTKSLLGFDPRGHTVILRDPTGSGTDVLVGTVPDDSTGSQACCTTGSDGESECEDVSPDPVTGVVTCAGTIPKDANGAPITSCLPDPCNPAAPPPTPSSGPGTSTVCCILDTQDAEATQTECDDSLGECAAHGGALVQVQLPATFNEGDNPCDLIPDPCQSVPTVTPTPGGPPPVPALCCVPHVSSDPTEVEAPECEDLPLDACTAIPGGAPPVNGLCNYTDASGAAASVPCP
jgi:hypothetical protein